MKVAHPTGILDGDVKLPGSKSISNRLLIIQSLCNHAFAIDGLSTADDTAILKRLLHQNDATYNAGIAGTTMRFMMAWLCLQPGTQVLTGERRLLQRPIAPLVDALRQVGASIEYLEAADRLPVAIGYSNQWKDRVTVSAAQSSQFISALLMIAPCLPQGLTITLRGSVASRPYIEMTRSLMFRLGVQSIWKKRTITVPHQPYAPPAEEIIVEPDWSAAAFFYEMTALANQAELEFLSLPAQSIQGDAIAADLFQPLGISTKLTDSGVVIKKIHGSSLPRTRINFGDCPDLAQPILVACAGLGIEGMFEGLGTLRVKETDRIHALQQELAKMGVQLRPQELLQDQVSLQTVEPQKIQFKLSGKANIPDGVLIETWQDHRMAMAFAPLGLIRPLEIENPRVVSKSFPSFWETCQQLGFELTNQQ